MTRTLVLGGSRFIGYHVVLELLRRGHEVTVFNRGMTPSPLPRDVERIIGDRLEPDSVSRALAGREFDAVVDTFARQPRELTPAVEALQDRVGRFVFCSTVAVYAPPERLPVLESDPTVEDRPGQRYAVTLLDRDFKEYPLGKLACEKYLLERWRRDRLPVTILRPVMVYGPHNASGDWELAQMARLLRGRAILVPGDGSRIMHFVHVEDLARGFVNALDTGASLGQTYNIAGPDAVSLSAYIRLVGRAVGVEPEIRYVPEGTTSSFPFIWNWSAIFDIGRARRDLGFEPRSMEAGLEETYRWYLANDLDSRAWVFSAADPARAPTLRRRGVDRPIGK